MAAAQQKHIAVTVSRNEELTAVDDDCNDVVVGGGAGRGGEHAGDSRLADVLRALQALHDRVRELLRQFNIVRRPRGSGLCLGGICVKDVAGEAGGKVRVMPAALLRIAHHDHDILLTNARLGVVRCCQGDSVTAVCGNMPLKCDCHA